jgi:hypothetical protein
MSAWLSKMVDRASDFFAHRRGLLPLVGILLIIINFILQFLLPPGLLRDSNLLLHLGLIVAIFGFMLSWAL